MKLVRRALLSLLLLLVTGAVSPSPPWCSSTPIPGRRRSRTCAWRS